MCVPLFRVISVKRVHDHRVLAEVVFTGSLIRLLCLFLEVGLLFISSPCVNDNVRIGSVYNQRRHCNS